MSSTDLKPAMSQDERPFQTPHTSFDSVPAQISGSATPSFPNKQGLSRPSSQTQTLESSSPGYSLAQFSFGPATQTTVVTTTTTTTTSFPPLIMRDPSHLAELDPKQFPLATTPTPAAIRNFSFDHDGRKAIFEEAEDASNTMASLLVQRQEMLEGNGTVQSVRKLGTDRNSLVDWPRQSRFSGRRLSASESPRLSPSPQLALESGRIQTPIPARKQTMRSQSGPNGRASRLQIVQTSTPITPSIDNHEDLPQRPTSQQRQSPSWHQGNTSDTHTDMTINLDAQGNGDSSMKVRPHMSYAQASGALHEGNTRRPSPLDINDAQDASLPSPSLSPVTAAANIATRKGYFDHSETLVNRSPPNEPAEEEGDNFFGSQETQTWSGTNALVRSFSGQSSQETANQPSMMDIPTILDSFDAMPQSVKSYVMFQLLRRCEKPVLQFVAENVNPALKCDFLSLLPPELSQHILSYLDAKSLCHAAQVSKKWRQVVDSSERTWKDLLYRDGYHLGLVELRRAITEGWGWQYGARSTKDDWEKDIGRLCSQDSNLSILPSSTTGDEDFAVEVTLQELQRAQSTPGKRVSKRKSSARSRASSRKVQKRKDTRNEEHPVFDTSALLKQVSTAEGPFAAAQVATLALPSPNHPDVGLESLRSMHLYKSLYRRQHLIDSYWMNETLKPKHLAFKAHGRHVVTCLHFDAERILTGSDDTNINVYDTKSGIQRNVLHGHEGGVWALKCYGNTLVSGSTDRSVRVWDIEQGVCKHVFHGHTSTVRCLIILIPTVTGRNSDGVAIIKPREPLIITGSRDSTLRIWRLPQAKDEIMTESMSPEQVEDYYFVRALTGHTHSVRAIAAHGDILVSGSYDSTVRVWRVSTGDSTFTLRGHTQKVYSVVLDTTRNRCISGSMDNTVKIWSLDDGSCLHSLEGHNSLVGLLDLEGDRLVSAAADSTLRIWDPESGHCKATLSAHTGAITCFQHDARKVISGSDRTLKMWNSKTGEFVRDLLTDLSGVWQVGFDGRRCVAAVQRDQLTYIEILDFGAARDGVPESKRGMRIEVDRDGEEISASPTMSDRNNDVFMALAGIPI